MASDPAASDSEIYKEQIDQKQWAAVRGNGAEKRRLVLDSLLSEWHQFIHAAISMHATRAAWNRRFGPEAPAASQSTGSLYLSGFSYVTVPPHHV